MYNTTIDTASADNLIGTPQEVADNHQGEVSNPVIQPTNPAFAIGRNFPTDALPNWVAVQSRRLAVHRNVDPAIPAIGFLGACSIAIGQGLDLQNGSAEGSVSTANLWLAIVGDPSCGKTTLTIPSQELEDLMKAQSDESKKRIKDLIARRKKLEAQARQLERAKLFDDLEKVYREIEDIEEEQFAIRPIWMANDFTPEAITQACACKGRPRVLSVVASEGRTMMSNLMGRYSKTANDDFFLSGWNRYTDSKTRIRKNYCKGTEDGFVPSMHISLCVGLQPDQGDFFRREPLCTSGFVQRLLYAYVDPPNELLNPDQAAQRARKLRVPAPDLKQWYDFTRALFEAGAFNEKAEVVKMTKGSAIEWRKFQDEVNRLRDNESHKVLRTQMGRWIECAGRVALVLHVMEHGLDAVKQKLSAKTMRDACRIVCWFGMKMSEHQKNAPIGPTRLERSICAYAQKQGNNGISVRDLTRAGVGERSELEPIINGLVPHRLVPIQTTRGKAVGRCPAQRWRYVDSAPPAVVNSLS
jgi:hypothetical protein